MKNSNILFTTRQSHKHYPGARTLDRIYKSKEHKLVSLIVETNPGISILFDSGYNLIGCNKAALELLGFETFKEMKAGFIQRVLDGIPEYQPDGNLSVPLAERFRTAMQDGYDRFVTHITLAGVERTLDVVFKKIVYDDDFLTIIYVYDLTDRIAREKELKAMHEAKSSFLSSMSHEIRTPLNAIIGMTSIGMSSKDPDKKDYAFGRIDSASKHLLGVINDILDMSKIEANKLVLSPVSFEFEDMLDKVIGIVEHSVSQRQQKLKIKVDKKIPQMLVGDDQRLAQVIANLLSNAVKFTPEGGTITLRAYMVLEENGLCRLKISVTDTGIGITDEQKKNLFEPFEQADAGTSRIYGGSGLGLSISKRIVDLMDGEIWVESEVEKGSTFTFTVSLLRDSAADVKIKDYDAVQPGASQKHCIDFAGRTVLVVEDIEINREIIQTMLVPYKLNIECAENGIIAIEKFVSEPKKYDMVFMDIHMPGLDGLETTRRIRAQDTPAAKNVPIIAMTANVFREDVEQCLNAGMNGHIGKPINIDDVVYYLKKFLGQPHKGRNN